MKPPSLSCARALRDGGIDAVAALNDALEAALVGIPLDSQSEIKLAIGRAMAAVIDEAINPGVKAFLESCANEMERMGSSYEHVHLSDRLKQFASSPHFVVAASE